MIFSHLSYGDLIIYMDHVTLIIDPGHMAALLKKEKKKKKGDTYSTSLSLSLSLSLVVGVLGCAILGFCYNYSQILT